MEIIIKSENVWQEKTQSGTVLIKQQAAIQGGRDFPRPFNLTVETAYPVGRYELSPDSFRVNAYSSLEINPYNISLVPVK